MGDMLTPTLTRRGLVGSALAGVTSVPGRPLAQPPSLLLPTPSATAGPFYPVSFPADTDADLVVLRGSDARALGTVTHVAGRVLTTDGSAVPGAVVEIWQCDANGRYHHPGDARGAAPDPTFQGYGQVRAGADGSYRFRTIRPVAYPGRTPHIHFAVQAPGRAPLVTQLYVEGERLNATDFLYRSLGDARRQAAVTIRLEGADGIEAGALAGNFNIVLA